MGWNIEITRLRPADVGVRRSHVNPTGAVMPATRFDLCGIGNAIVDVVAPVAEAFLSKHDMHKGGMALISAEQAAAIYASMPPGQESSGGSVANTCAVASGLGARVGFLGKVADDELGQVFRHDITAAGVAFPTAPLRDGAPTARCLIAVTSDGQRTMNTFLGACVTFGPEDLDEAMIADSAVTDLEGYLFDPPHAQAAFRRAAEVAHAAGRQVALSLSDAFCVSRHRAAFQDLVAGHVDILFANETEICALYEENDFDAAAGRASRDVVLAALTKAEAGSLVLHRGERIAVPAAPATVVDTTGAGDAYAAGFLAGMAAGRTLASSAALGSRAAAAVIGQYGARPLMDLKAMAAV
jgi:sugar/nucleoside kinase (ribokinase family)